VNSVIADFADPYLLGATLLAITTVLLTTTLASELGLPSPGWTGLIVSWILLMGAMAWTFPDNSHALVRPSFRESFASFATAGAVIALYLGALSGVFHLMRGRQSLLRYGVTTVVGLIGAPITFVGMIGLGCMLLNECI
jgi:hypothetical protein